MRQNGEIPSIERGTGRDSCANETAPPDHRLTTAIPKGGYDYDGERTSIRRVVEALERKFPNGYDALVADIDRLWDDFRPAFCNHLGLDPIKGRATLVLLMQALDRAYYKTDWRLGYGKVRDDATVPEVASSLAKASAELLATAFDGGGIRTYRNRHKDFLEALAALAVEAEGASIANATFYQRLGMQVARHVLDHVHLSPEPQLAPSVTTQGLIEQVALEQLVYFIQCGESGPIKIGIAKDPASRLSGLQTGHHETLHLRAITEGGAEKEKAYHAQFAAHHARGEWFAPHPDILAEIARLTRPATIEE